MKHFLTWSFVVVFLNILHLSISLKYYSSKTLPPLSLVVLLSVHSFDVSHFFILLVVSSVNSSILLKDL